MENFVLYFCIVILLFAVIASIPSGRSNDQERYEEPEIVAARYNRLDCTGEFEVTSSHGAHVLRELDLPRHSIVTTLRRNSLYLVTFPIPQKRTPGHWKTSVWGSSGREEVEVNYPFDRFGRDFVRDAAAQNGYRGRVEG